MSGFKHLRYALNALMVSAAVLYAASGALFPANAGPPAEPDPTDGLAYAGAETVLGGVLKPGMTPFQKELAVHDWMVNNITYDTASADIYRENGGSGSYSRYPAFNAYGAIVGKKAVCEGYAKAFQMFMDIIGVECVSVSGFAEGGAHMWNQVKLDGDWYNVDVTFDDPIVTFTRLDGSAYTRPHNPGYEYFNVPDDVLAKDHTWDRADCNACAAVRYYLQPSIDAERQRMYEAVAGAPLVSTLAEADKVIAGGKYIFIDKDAAPTPEAWRNAPDLRECFAALFAMRDKFGLELYRADFDKIDAEASAANGRVKYDDFRYNMSRNIFGGNRGIAFFVTPYNGGTTYCVQDIAAIDDTFKAASDGLTGLKAKSG